MKLINRLIRIFFDLDAHETKSLTPLEREKRDAFLMLFPF